MPEDPTATGLVVVDEGVDVQTPVARPPKVVFSENGLHWALAGGIALGDPFAVDAAGKPLPPTRGPVVVLHDGREVGRHGDTSYPALDAGGARIAYLARDDGQVRLIVDGQASAAYHTRPGSAPPTIGEHVVGPTMHARYSVRFLSDGSLLSVADHADGWAVRHDARELATYAWATEPFASGAAPATPEGLEGRAAFIPASITAARGAPVALWWERPAGDATQWRVVRGGQPVDTIPCPRPWETERPVISPDGEHAAYVCAWPEPAPEGDLTPRETMWVVHDGRRLGPYPMVWGVALSPDGRHVAYAASDGAVPQAHWRYHRDGLPFGPEFLETWSARFGPDGRRLAWEARGADGVTRLYFDDVPIARFDEVLWGPSFLGADAVGWVVGRDDRLWRVEAWVGTSASALLPAVGSPLSRLRGLRRQDANRRRRHGAELDGRYSLVMILTK
jgi:hypothetical protein